MKTKKLLTAVLVLAIVLGGVATVSFAAVAGQTPAELVADLTGRSVESVTADREAGETYGAQADEAGKLAEFKAQRLELFEARLADWVEQGVLSQAEADERLKLMTQRMETCTGTGTGAGAGLAGRSGGIGACRSGSAGTGFGGGMMRGGRA